MENKILIKLSMPEIESTFDLFIPVNEIVWKVKKMVLKSISDLTGGIINFNEEYILINQDNGRTYKNNEIIIDTDIRNATCLMLIKRNI